MEIFKLHSIFLFLWLQSLVVLFYAGDVSVWLACRLRCPNFQWSCRFQPFCTTISDAQINCTKFRIDFVKIKNDWCLSNYTVNYRTRDRSSLATSKPLFEYELEITQPISLSWFGNCQSSLCTSSFFICKLFEGDTRLSSLIQNIHWPFACHTLSFIFQFIANW